MSEGGSLLQGGYYKVGWPYHTNQKVYFWPWKFSENLTYKKGKNWKDTVIIAF